MIIFVLLKIIIFVLNKKIIYVPNKVIIFVPNKTIIFMANKIIGLGLLSDPHFLQYLLWNFLSSTTPH